MRNYKHDCDECKFLGTDKVDGMEVDIYFCPKSLLPGGSIIIRNSSEHFDYWSMPIGVLNNLPKEIQRFRLAMEWHKRVI